MFSVVIPLFNKQSTILRTVYSVLTQSYKNFEVIIIDDGSSDNGVGLINEKINDERIKIISQTNQGVSAARNKGVLLAKYKYIAFLDADDEWLPNYLETVKNAIDIYPHAGIFCTPGLHRSIVTGEGKFWTINKYKGKVLEVDYFKDPKLIGGQTSGVVVSKLAFNDIEKNYEGNGFPLNLNLNEDWACFQSIALIYKAVYIGFPLTIRNIDVQGQLVQLDDNGFDMRLNKSPVYLNITYNNYLKTNKLNNSFISYRKYEIRSFISFFLRMNAPEDTVNNFLKKIDKQALNLFSNLEHFIYTKISFKYFSLLFIALTKIKRQIKQKISN